MGKGLYILAACMLAGCSSDEEGRIDEPHRFPCKQTRKSSGPQDPCLGPSLPPGALFHFPEAASPKGA